MPTRRIQTDDYLLYADVGKALRVSFRKHDGAKSLWNRMQNCVLAGKPFLYGGRAIDAIGLASRGRRHIRLHRDELGWFTSAAGIEPEIPSGYLTRNGLSARHTSKAFRDVWDDMVVNLGTRTEARLTLAGIEFHMMTGRNGIHAVCPEGDRALTAFLGTGRYPASDPDRLTLRGLLPYLGTHDRDSKETIKAELDRIETDLLAGRPAMSAGSPIDIDLRTRSGGGGLPFLSISKEAATALAGNLGFIFCEPMGEGWVTVMSVAQNLSPAKVARIRRFVALCTLAVAPGKTELVLGIEAVVIRWLGQRIHGTACIHRDSVPALGRLLGFDEDTVDKIVGNCRREQAIDA